MIKILTGDCIEVLQGMAPESVQCCVADPPYGIDYQSARRTDRSKWKPKIKNDKEPFLSWVSGVYRVLVDGGRLFCFYRWDVQEEFMRCIEGCGFMVKSQIVWDKCGHGMGDLTGEFAPAHECVLYATKGRYVFSGPRPKSIIQCPKIPPEKLLHPNEKPPRLIEELIVSVTTEGDIVLDPFCGVGSAGLAASRLDRDYIGIELNPEYAEMSRKRLLGDSPLFNEVELVL